MRVDEARSEIAVRCIDDCCASHADATADRADPPIADRQIGAKPRRAGAVDDAGILDEHRLGHFSVTLGQCNRLDFAVPNFKRARLG
jgi:hypothetical protein